MKISIEISKTLRTLNEGQNFEFDFDSPKFNKENWIFIVGDNGCGKSTLVNCIRNWQCNNDESKGGEGSKLGYLEIREFADHCKITSDFEKIFILSSEFDDQFSYKNAGDASSFIENGGWQTRFCSNGQRSLNLLGSWLEKNKDKFDENTLIIFDEIDKGYSLKYQVGFMKMLNNLSETYGVKFLIVTHNILPLMMAKNHIFNMEHSISEHPKLYLAFITGKLFIYEDADFSSKDFTDKLKKLMLE